MKRVKSLVSILLAICLLLGCFPATTFAAGGCPFRDIQQSDWYFDAVQYVYDREIMRGTSDTAFSPNMSTTRAMIVSMLHRMAGSPVSPATYFSDVDRGSWYAKSVDWANFTSVASGYGNGLFGPEDAITREQTVSILYRYAQKMGIDTSARGDLFRYPDADQTSLFAEEAMRWAVGTGLLSGLGDGTISPRGISTRAQIASIFKRFCENVLSQGNPEQDFMVYFDLQDGSDTAPSSVSVPAGGTVPRPVDPVRVGYRFTGWYTDAGCTTSFDFASAITRDITLYAGWEPDGGNENEAFVSYISDILSIGYSDGDYEGSVIGNLTLPTELEGAQIAWSSSNEYVVSDTGVVTRPQENTEVTLTAQITYQGASTSKPFTITVIRGKEEEDPEERPNHSVVDLQDMNRDSEQDFFIEYSEDNSQVTVVNGKTSDVVIESSEDAMRSLGSVRTILGIASPEQELDIAVVNHDKYGTSYTFGQQYDGIPVYGRSVTISADGEGTSSSLTSDFLSSASLDSMNSYIGCTEQEAINIVREMYGNGVEVSSQGMTIYSLDEYKEAPVQAYMLWVSSAEGVEGDTIDETVIVNAATGGVISVYTNLLDWGDAMVTGNGVNEQGQNVTFPVQFKQWDWLFYYMQDSNRNITMYNGGLINNRVGSEFNRWTDATAISAYTNMIKVYDWYQDTLGRRSVDNNGKELKVTVHKSGSERDKSNACWTGNEFWFYDNRREHSYLATTTASGLDVLAHEYTHGVVQYKTGNGLAHGHSNGHISYAINEAYADIFGWFVDNQNTTIGEDWMTLRNLANPASCNTPSRVDGANWYEWGVTGSNVSAYAHTNSSVISHAAYLMSQGYSYDGLPAITGQKLIDLWYGSLDRGFSASSTFQTVRRNVLLQADVQGLSPLEKRTIKWAFDDVNIPGDKGTLSISAIDSQTQDPVQDAHVLLYQDGYLVGEEYTSPEGLVELLTDIGDYQLVVEKEDYITFTANASILKDRTTSISVPMVHAGTGAVSGTITSATTGMALEGVTLNIRPGWDSTEEPVQTLTTGSEGNYTFTADAGYYTVEMSMEGYTTASFNVTVNGGMETANQNGSISPLMQSNQYRVVLTWGENPSDLDSHLVGHSPDSYHIYFADQNAYGQDGSHLANLDVDDVTSYGPETVTFTASMDGEYEYFVHWYAGYGTWGGSEAKVELYNGSNLVAVYNISPDLQSSGGSWNVFRLSHGILINVNTMS